MIQVLDRTDKCDSCLVGTSGAPRPESESDGGTWTCAAAVRSELLQSRTDVHEILGRHLRLGEILAGATTHNTLPISYSEWSSQISPSPLLRGPISPIH